MKMLGWNLALALAWCAMAGTFTTLQFTVGFVIAYAVLGWLAPTDEARVYVLRVPRIVRFAVTYALEVVRSALRVAYDVVTPSSRRRPGIVAVPVAGLTDAELALFANLITFTPGTLALDVTADRQCMLVHGMFVDDFERARRDLIRLQAGVLRILR